MSYQDLVQEGVVQLAHVMAVLRQEGKAGLVWLGLAAGQAGPVHVEHYELLLAVEATPSETVAVGVLPAPC